jgi:RNA-binding protein YlmH
MDRKKFINNFPNEDEFFLASLCDDIELCEEIDYPVFSKFFYPPQIWSKLCSKSISNISFSALGINENSERKIIAIFPKECESFLNFPIEYFKIDGTNKFKELLHKDFLGTIMSLGIRREYLGDLVVKDNICYGIIMDNLFSLLQDEIKFVGNIPVKISKIPTSEIPTSAFEEIVETVSSLRLDAIITALTNGSRTLANDFLNAGLVALNYNIEKEKSKFIEVGDIISIRKRGKFILEKILGESKKGKTRLLFKKFS